VEELFFSAKKVKSEE